jgi:ribonuclease P protein component
MYKFPKTQKICNAKDITQLFAKGDSILLYPLSIRFIIKKESSFPEVKILIVSPKRYQKFAVNRNKIKRLIRENYRINKADIISFAKQKNISINLSISYISHNTQDLNLIKTNIPQVLSIIIKKITHKLEKDNQDNK